MYAQLDIRSPLSIKKNINIENGYITLTAEGESLARKIVERHRVLCDFLQQLGVDADVAADDACKMEHIISDETFEKMKEYVAQNDIHTC